MNIKEIRNTIPRLQALYEKKLTKLRAFQNGKDIWKTDKY